MKFNELPLSVQEKLNQQRAKVHESWKLNEPYVVQFTNKEGTRCFYAQRRSNYNRDNRGCKGGSYWEVMYYAIAVKAIGGGMLPQYTLSAGQKFSKSFNGTEIPKYVNTKAEVLEIAKKIGTLEM